MNWAQPFQRANNTLGTRTALAVTLDARQNTEFGLLRTVVTPRIDYRVGSESSGSAGREGLNFRGTNNEGGVAKDTQFNAVGFFQLGGFTAGHMGSTFNVVSPTSNIGLDGWDQRDLTNVVAYTFSLGNGITLTGSLEDGTIVNRQGIYNAGFARAVTYGANKLPDYIGVLSAAQSWGTVALSGAVHTINTSDAQIGTEYGYAVQLGTKVNLPMISNGSYLFLNGIYTVGANGFSLRDVAGDITSNSTTTMGIGRVAVGMNDAVLTATGSVEKAKVYGGAAEFGYQVTPTVLAYVGGSYTKLDWSAAAQAVTPAAINPANMLRLTTGLQWTPIKGFRVFPDVEWSKISVKNATNAGAVSEGAAKKNESAWTARVQVRRDF